MSLRESNLFDDAITFEMQCRLRVRRYEGYANRVYLDSQGKKTIGIGFNLERREAPSRIAAVGADYIAIVAGDALLSDEQIQTLFSEDLADAGSASERFISNIRDLADPRRFVVIDLLFNLGEQEFSHFRGTIAAIEAGDFEAAAAHLQHSLWFSQVGHRAIEDCSMMRSGKWFDPPELLSDELREHFEAISSDSPDLPTPASLTPLNYVTLRKGLFDDTTASDLADAFAKFNADATQRMVISFHGGVVDRGSGMDLASFLLPRYSTAAYPLFIVWESGLFEVVRDYLPEIFEESLFQRTTTLIAVFLQQHYQPSGAMDLQVDMTATVGLMAQARLAVANVDESPLRTLPPPNDEAFSRFAASVNEDPVIRRELIAIASQSPLQTKGDTRTKVGNLIRSSPRTLMSPSIVAAIAAKEDERQSALAFGVGDAAESLVPMFSYGAGVASIARNVIQRFATHRDHGMPCTLTEEVLRAMYVANAGTWVWQGMKADIEGAFATPEAGGNIIVANIVNLRRTNPRKKVTLFGHSAGSIYVCHLLRALDEAFGSTAAQFDVVLMAPAVTIDLWEQTRALYGHRIAGFRMFALHDSVECSDAIVGPLYPRSLLYFVSGVCEGAVKADVPLLGMERFLTAAPFADPNAFPNECRAREFLSTAGRLFLSRTGAMPVGGEETEALHHGAFPHDPSTLHSCTYLLTNGVPNA